MRKFKLKKRRGYKPKRQWSVEKIRDTIVNAELRKYGVTVKDIMALPEGKIEGENWFTYYTFKTLKEEDVWSSFANKIIRRHLRPYYISKKAADRELCWAKLNWGLKNEEYVRKFNTKNQNNS